MAEELITLPDLLTNTYEVVAQIGLKKNQGPNPQSFLMWGCCLDIEISQAKNDSVRVQQLRVWATNQFMKS